MLDQEAAQEFSEPDEDSPTGRTRRFSGKASGAEYVYQVVSGSVRTYKLLSDGRRQIGSFHLPGDVFGMESGSTHRLAAEAIVETTVRLVKRSAIEKAATMGVQVARNWCSWMWEWPLCS